MRADRQQSGDGSARAPHVADEQRFLELVFRQMPGAVWATDRALKLVCVIGRVPGVRDPSEQFVGLTVFDYVGTRDEEHPAVKGHRTALEGGRAHFRYEREGRCYELLIEPLYSDEHAIIGAVGAAVDVTERRAAEARLADSETRLSAAQRLAHVGSWEWDIRRDELWWSEEMHHIYGLEPGTFPGGYEAFIERVHPNDRAQTESALLSTLRTRSRFDYTHRIVRPDGVLRTLHTRGAPDVDAEGHVTRLVGSCWDVTEQIDAKNALEKSVSLLRATLNSTADGILVVDRQGHITAFNDRFAELWRLPRRILDERDDERLLAAVVEQLEDPEGFQGRVRALYAAPEEESYDEVRFRDGRVFERYSRPQRVGDDIIGRVWSFRDVTERETLLARATFLADASRLLATLDADRALERIASLAIGTIAAAAAVDLFGNEGPRRLVTVCREDEPAELAVASAALPHRPQLYQGTGRAWMSVPVFARSTLLAALRCVAPEGRAYRDADLGTVMELAGRIALALENARVHEEACAALRARDEVLGIAAHEIRGPLTSMRLAIQTLKMKPAAKAERLAFDLLERENRRLSRFVDELLDAVRIHGGLLTLRLEQVELSKVVHDVAERLAEEVRRSGSRLAIAMNGPVVGVWDRDRLEQAIGNLLSNAVKYGLGRPIAIEVSSDDTQAVVTVTDHGMGIAADKIERLFKPFERGVSSRHYGGLGLGLYIVRTIVESLGGSVDVESELDKGSRFRIRLPRTKPDA